jgi:hypothetical protein
MGVVFQDRQVSLNRPLALKMIRSGQLAAETDVKRFYTKAEAAANLVQSLPPTALPPARWSGFLPYSTVGRPKTNNSLQ